MKPGKKKRCWKGCKPVPGKKPYSEGSCSCQMSDLRPGMIALNSITYHQTNADILRRKASLHQQKRDEAMGLWPLAVAAPGALAAAPSLRVTAAKKVAETGAKMWDGKQADNMAHLGNKVSRVLQKHPGKIVGGAAFVPAALIGTKLAYHTIAGRKNNKAVNSELKQANDLRRQRNARAAAMRLGNAEMSALTPGMIAFARGDFAIPALKKALKKGIGNAGEPVSIHEIGVSGTMIPSLRKNPANVRRATKKYWGEDEGLAQATEAMRYNRDWAAKTIVESRKQRGIKSFRWTGAKPRPQVPRRDAVRPFVDAIYSRFASLTPGMIAFALGEDNRPRNGNGQFVANETGGADPNSMAAAYGGVQQEKEMRRRSLMARLKGMMGRPEQPVM